MLGPAAGLYRVALLLPGMNKVREPIQGWFIVALGLAHLQTRRCLQGCRHPVEYPDVFLIVVGARIAS